MRERGTFFIISCIIINFILLSFLPTCYAQNFTQSSIAFPDDINQVSAYFHKLYPQKTDLLEKKIAIYYTLSNSGNNSAHHLQFPFVLRTIKPTGVCILVYVKYSSMEAQTTVVDRSGTILQDIQGPHGIFFIGFGVIGYNGSLFNSPLWFAAMSITEPRVIP